MSLRIPISRGLCYDARWLWGTSLKAITQCMWPCSDLKVIIKPNLVKGAQILEMQTEKPLTQRTPTRI